MLWQDIEDHYAGCAEVKGSSCFLKETDVTAINVHSSGEDMFRENMDRVAESGRITVFSSGKSRK